MDLGQPGQRAHLRPNNKNLRHFHRQMPGQPTDSFNFRRRELFLRGRLLPHISPDWRWLRPLARKVFRPFHGGYDLQHHHDDRHNSTE